MRCPYCRSVTHDTDCPKAFEDKILPIYSAVHKLSIIERRAFLQQAPLYGLADAKGVVEQIKTLIKGLVTTENVVTTTKPPKK